MTKPERSQKHAVFPLAAIIALTALGAAARLWGLTSRGFWTDEMESLCLARAPLADLAGFLWNSPSLPVYFLLARPFAALSHAEWAIRLLSVLAGTATVPAVYFLAGQTFKGKRAPALAAAALAAFSPPLILFSQMARPYALLAFGATMHFALFLKILHGEEANRKTTLAYIAVGVLTLYTSLLYALSLACQAAVAFAALKLPLLRPARTDEKAKNRFLPAVLPLAVLATLAPWLPSIAATGQYQAAPAAGASSLFGAFHFFKTLVFFGAGFPFDMTWHSGLAVAGFAVLAILGLIKLVGSRNPSLNASMAFAIIGMLTMNAVFVLQNNQFFQRYYIIFVPMWLLLAAAPTLLFEKRKSPPVRGADAIIAAVVFVAIAALFLPCVWNASRRTHFYFQDWRESIRWIQERAEPGDRIVASGLASFMLPYYLGENEKNLAVETADSTEQMREKLSQGQRRWVLYYEADGESIDPAFRHFLAAQMTPSDRKARVWDIMGVDAGLITGFLAVGGDVALDLSTPSQMHNAAVEKNKGETALKLAPEGWAAFNAITDAPQTMALEFSGYAPFVADGPIDYAGAATVELSIRLGEKEIGIFSNEKGKQDIAGRPPLPLAAGGNDIWFRLLPHSQGTPLQVGATLTRASLKSAAPSKTAPGGPVHLKYEYWRALSKVLMKQGAAAQRP